MAALEQALTPRIPGGHTGWAERVEVALVELSADFDEHIAVTEGSGGLHDAVVAATPRLSNAVSRLGGEHIVIKGLIEDLLLGLARRSRRTRSMRSERSERHCWGAWPGIASGARTSSMRPMRSTSAARPSAGH